MKINNEDLEEFIRLYNEAFAEYISEEEAQQVASRLVDLYTLLTEPLPSEPGKTTPLAGEDGSPSPS